MNWQSFRYSLAFGGLAVGLAVPLICIVLSSIWDVDGFAYLTLFIPALFAIFGFLLGYLMDKLSEQKKTLENINSSLKEQSILDELTGQYNRRHILQELDKELDRARRYKHTLAGIMIDVDDFKKINDRHGHLFGDHILKEVTKIFDHCVRTIDILGRYGGDEFIILLPEATPDTAGVVAERIKNAIHKHAFEVKKKKFKVTVSVGAQYFHDLTDMSRVDFIDKIDQALYKAKAAGKDRVIGHL